MLLTIIILTFNSEKSVGAVLDACQSLNARILVVDSGSTDGTVELALAAGAEVKTREFENYSAQRNWAESVAEVPESGWILHLDSDEVPTPELIESILRALKDPKCDGYLVKRITYFLGKRIGHGHMNPNWHLRLYRSTFAQCEHRLYDQHFVQSKGVTGKLDGELWDIHLMSLETWTNSHNRWSSAEAVEVLQEARADESVQLESSLVGDSRMRKRWVKNKLWYKLPPLYRSFVFFGYSYFFKLGFLDGRAGLVYHVLQAFWFRFLVDAKVLEATEFATNRMPILPKDAKKS